MNAPSFLAGFFCSSLAVALLSLAYSLIAYRVWRESGTVDGYALSTV
jgi:hypothetical protein